MIILNFSGPTTPRMKTEPLWYLPYSIVNAAAIELRETMFSSEEMFYSRNWIETIGPKLQNKICARE